MNEKQYRGFERAYELEKESILIACGSFNKAIVTLSTGILGFGFAIIKFGSDQKLLQLWSLKLTFILAVAAIISIVISFYLEQLHSNTRIEYLQKVLSSSIYEKEPDDCAGNWMSKFSVLALILFVFAVASFVYFSFSNF